MPSGKRGHVGTATDANEHTNILRHISVSTLSHQFLRARRARRQGCPWVRALYTGTNLVGMCRVKRVHAFLCGHIPDLDHLVAPSGGSGKSHKICGSGEGQGRPQDAGRDLYEIRGWRARQKEILKTRQNVTGKRRLPKTKNYLLRSPCVSDRAQAYRRPKASFNCTLSSRLDLDGIECAKVQRWRDGMTAIRGTHQGRSRTANSEHQQSLNLPHK